MLLLDVPLGAGRAGLRSPVLLADPLVPARVGQDLPATREAIALVIVQFVETMSGIRAVQAFRREPRNQEIFEDVTERYRAASTSARRADRRLHARGQADRQHRHRRRAALRRLPGAGRASMTIGVLTAFLLYLRRFFEPMQEISQFYNTFQSATAALEKLSGVLEEPPARARAVDPGARWPSPRRRLRFEDVAFGYVDGAPVLPDLDLVSRPGRPWPWSARPAPARRRSPGCSPGSTTPAGAGAAGRRRPARPRGGRPAPRCGDGHPGELPVRRHRRRQHRVRPAGRDRGRGRGRCSGDRRGRGSSPRCRTATTPTSRKRGGRLSAGQRQLVAFARAFLADPAVLILDEATSLAGHPQSSGWCSARCARSWPTGRR